MKDSSETHEKDLKEALDFSESWGATFPSWFKLTKERKDKLFDRYQILASEVKKLQKECKQKDTMWDAVRETFNTMGGPTMTYAPAIEAKEWRARWDLCYALLLKPFREIQNGKN